MAVNFKMKTFQTNLFFQLTPILEGYFLNSTYLCHLPAMQQASIAQPALAMQEKSEKQCDGKKFDRKHTDIYKFSNSFWPEELKYNF